MRLRCTVKVVSRVGNGAPGAESRFSASTLALASSPSPSAPPSVYMLHFSAANKHGKRYRLASNVEQVFVRFCSEGKATVKFSDPPHDLYVQADPVQLKAFLKILKLCLEGKTDGSDLSRLSSVVTVAKNAPVTKLVVASVSDFPVKGLPRTLLVLRMAGLRMCTFKREILTLRSLRSLDLSDNNLERLPAELGKMPCMAELFLSKNKLGCANSDDWKWLEGVQITAKLKLLDLSSNTLHNVPNTIFKLKNLVTLNLDDNEINRLPKGIGTIKTLRFLSASKNNLQVLPTNLLCLRLEKADFSLNRTNEEVNSGSSVVSFKISSLVELSSAAVLKHRLYYAKNIIPYTLVDYLDNSNYCVCGKPTFDSKNYVRTISSLKSFCETIVVSDGNYHMNFECYLCSYSCYKKLILNRNM